MTPIATARSLARTLAKSLGHDVTRMTRSGRSWVGSCRACGRTLSVEPLPAGEWSITGDASYLKCATSP